MLPEQERIYNELKTFCTAQLSEQSFVTATQVITQMLRLHQVLCGHVTDEQGVEHEIETNRTKELLLAIDELISKSPPCCCGRHCRLVWADHVSRNLRSGQPPHSASRPEAQAADHPPAEYCGGAAHLQALAG